MPPTGMSPTGGATTVDYDGKGRIWASAPDGALMFDPEDGKVHRVQIRHLQDARTAPASPTAPPAIAMATAIGRR